MLFPRCIALTLISLYLVRAYELHFFSHTPYGYGRVCVPLHHCLEVNPGLIWLLRDPTWNTISHVLCRSSGKLEVLLNNFFSAISLSLSPAKLFLSILSILSITFILGLRAGSCDPGAWPAGSLQGIYSFNLLSF